MESFEVLVGFSGIAEHKPLLEMSLVATIQGDRHIFILFARHDTTNIITHVGMFHCLHLRLREGLAWLGVVRG